MGKVNKMSMELPPSKWKLYAACAVEHCCDIQCEVVAQVP